MTELCPQCGQEFKSVTHHWLDNKSHKPTFSKRQLDILKGVLLGDAHMGKPNANNPRIVISNSNLRFLKHIKQELGVLANEVRHTKTPEEVSEDNPENASHQYELSTKHNDELEPIYKEWITDGKNPPFESININETIIKYWYVCDGGLGWRQNQEESWYADAMIHVVTQSNKINNIKEMLASIGPEPRTYTDKRDESRVIYSPSQTEILLEQLGEPIPGMEYKWETESRSTYDELKSNSRSYIDEQLIK